MEGKLSRALLALGLASALAFGAAAPSLAQSPSRTQHRSVSHATTQSSTNTNGSNAFASSQDHQGQCWLPGESGMNPNSSFGSWVGCNSHGSVPER